MIGEHHTFGPSSLARREACPGSWRIEKDLPSFDTEDAAAGTSLHASIEKDINDFLKGKPHADNSNENVENMFRYFLMVAAVESVEDPATLPEKIAAGDGVEVFTEKKLVYRYAGIEQYSGTADVVILSAEKLIIVDWKTGHRQVDRAADNLQLAAYALAAMQEFKRTSADVYIYNPVILQDERAHFDDAQAIARYILKVIADCQEDSAPLRPSEDACRYCKGMHYGTCPAVRNTAELAVRDAAKITPLPRLSALETSVLLELADKCEMVGKLSARVDAEIRRRCEADGSCGPFRLKEKSGGREITDIPKAFELSGMEQSVFLDCCTASVAKLEKSFAKALKASGAAKTEKEGKEIFAGKLAEVIAEKPPRMELVKI